MTCLNMESGSLFLEETKTKDDLKNDENIFRRFIRKKYKCLILWGLTVLAIVEMGIIILDKVDETMINKALDALFNKPTNTSHNLSILIEQLSKLVVENYTFSKYP